MQTNLLGQIEPTTITQQQNSTQEGVGDSNLDQQDFLNLLVTQLQNQDPLNPTDNSEFMSQTTAFSQLNEMTNMNTSLEKMLELLSMQAYNNSSLTSGSGFIGKEIEYQTNTVTVGGDSLKNISFQTNTVTVGGDSLKNISFYLGDDALAEKSQINIYNEDGACVAIVKPDKDLTSGQNIIHWDGTGVGGVEVADGTYYFEVQAFNSAGEQVEVQEYGTGIVQGVKMSNGVLYFDIGTGVVSSEYVYSVYDPSLKNEGEGSTDSGSSNNSSSTGSEADEKAI